MRSPRPRERIVRELSTPNYCRPPRYICCVTAVFSRDGVNVDTRREQNDMTAQKADSDDRKPCIFERQIDSQSVRLFLITACRQPTADSLSFLFEIVTLRHHRPISLWRRHLHAG